jgi:hypothetical protein
MPHGPRWPIYAVTASPACSHEPMLNHMCTEIVLYNGRLATPHIAPHGPPYEQVCTTAVRTRALFMLRRRRGRRRGAVIDHCRSVLGMRNSSGRRGSGYERLAQRTTTWTNDDCHMGQQEWPIARTSAAGHDGAQVWGPVKCVSLFLPLLSGTMEARQTATWTNERGRCAPRTTTATDREQQPTTRRGCKDRLWRDLCTSAGCAESSGGGWSVHEN